MWPDVTDEMKENSKKQDITFYNYMESLNKDSKSDEITESQGGTTILSKSVLRDDERRNIEKISEPILIQQRAQLTEMKEDLENTCNYIKALENKSTKEFDLLEYDGYPLIWSFYSRFFPVKLVISVLAHIMYQDKTDYVYLDKFEKRAHNIATTSSE